MSDATNNRRAWTDDELAIAVYNARSWRGVLRNLGLYENGPTHVVRREAGRLGLDTSHFGSGVRWSDAQLTAALGEAVSWPQLLSSLGMRPESRRSKEKVKARAAQLSLSLDHLAHPSRPRTKPPEELSDLGPDAAYLRNAAQSLVTAWFLLRGIWTAAPTEPRPYDLLLESRSGVKRIQVKTTTCTASSGAWYVKVARHAGGGDRHNHRLPYRADEVDLFAILDGEFVLYLIPITAVSGRTAICLAAYRQFIVGSAASMFSGRPEGSQQRRDSPIYAASLPVSDPRRLGIEFSRITLGPKAGREAIGIDVSDRPTLDHLRHAAPSIAAAWFLFCGRSVSVPCEPQAYDLIVDLAYHLRRVQVKSATSRDARGAWNVRIGHRPDGSPKAADFIPYDPDEVELFFVVDGSLLLYLIPASAAGGKTTLSLGAYRDFIVGDASSLMVSLDPTLGSGASPLRPAS